MANGDVAKIVDSLFSIAGVQRVVSIDDMNAIEAPVEDALALVQRLQDTDIARIFADYQSVISANDLDIRLREIRRVWDSENDDRRRFLLNGIRARVAEIEAVQSARPSTEVVDENTFLELSTLFKNYGLELLSLKQWQEKQGEIISEAMPRTLFLVDEDFSKEEGGTRLSGIKIIKAVMGAAPADKMLCALLSHNPRYQADTLHESWKKLSRDQDLDPSRFVLIPKKLVKDDPIGFCRLVKLALLNRQVGELKKTARDILRTAQDNAHKRLDDIDIYDFDQIVFRSSWREGVWEPDTLFRVFGLFHHDETRKIAKDAANLYSIADAIRTLSLVPTKSPTAPNYNTIALQRLELYEDGDYLNAHFIPIDMGDIFQKTGESQKRYILLAQPCDLMVRADGKRNPFVNEALLAEIIPGPVKDRDAHCDLPFFDSADDGLFVSFKRTHSVKLDCLDLCALNETGSASLDLTTPGPERAIPAWKERRGKLVKEFQKLLNKVEEFTKAGVSLNNVVKMAASSSNSGLLKPTIDVGRKTLSFDFKRIARLRQPRAAAMLSRFANFMTREAFEHDFADRDEQVAHDGSEQSATTGPAAARASDAPGDALSIVAVEVTSLSAEGDKADSSSGEPKQS